MSELILWHLEASPPARAVRILADILGLKLELKELDFFKMEHKSPEFKKINPLGTVPVFKDGDFLLTDSHAIMTYLLHKFGSEHCERLYPSELRTRALVDQCMFFDTGVYFIKLKVVTLPTIFQGLAAPTDRHIQEIEDAYQAVETFLGDKRYIATEHMTIADISVGITTVAMQAIHKVDENKYPRIVAWLSRLNEVPQFKKHASESYNLLKTIFEKYWNKNKQ